MFTSLFANVYAIYTHENWFLCKHYLNPRYNRLVQINMSKNNSVRITMIHWHHWVPNFHRYNYGELETTVTIIFMVKVQHPVVPVHLCYFDGFFVQCGRVSVGMVFHNHNKQPLEQCNRIKIQGLLHHHN